MFLFFLMAVVCFLNVAICDKKFKSYKNGEYMNVKKIGYGTYTVKDSGPAGLTSSLRYTRIKHYVLDVELPLNIGSSPLELNIDTTNHRAKKYKNKPYVDLFVTYHSDGRLENAIIKEDKAASRESFISLFFGSLFLAIFIFGIVIELI